MANENLTNAKKSKNDEFYTQYIDIEKEISAYLDYDKDVFKNKVILLPCDDPEWSNFTKYFAQNFERFSLKKLISTSYAIKSKNDDIEYTPTSFEINNPQFDKSKTIQNGKIFILDHDTTNDGKIDINDLEWHYLEGDGDFRSEEIRKLREEADIVITNPPFSLFYEFLSWIIEAKKQFIIIGNINAITYDNVFPFIKENKVWLGNGFHAGNAYFSTPNLRDFADGVYDSKSGLVKFRNCCWYTNFEHGRRHQPLQLMSMEDNLKFNKNIIKQIKNGDSPYSMYDNFEAIEVPFTNAIPSDYNGIMGVPQSFLDKYNPEQFEIIGKMSNTKVTNYNYGYPYVNGIKKYARILIKHKKVSK